MIIETATVDDAAEILALQKLAYQTEAALYDDYSIPPLVQTLDQMVADIRQQVVLKAVRDGRIVGSVRGYLRDGTCHIGRLIVHPEQQNQGLGTRLMNEIERHFSTARRYALFTGDRSERNLYLYRKLGYRACHTEQLTGNVTVVYLEKRGQATPLTGEPPGSS